MKLMIVSDIHGSAYYCEKMMERFNEEKPDRLLMLGDYLYHGPRNDLPKDYDPKRVIAMLNSIKDYCIAVRGNCDSEVDQMVLEFPIMDDYKMIEVDNKKFYLTHGHIYNENKPVKDMEGILLCGHTHIPDSKHCDSFIYLNPGSVSIPKDNSKHSYMIYDDKTFYWKEIENGETYSALIYKEIDIKNKEQQ